LCAKRLKRLFLSSLKRAAAWRTRGFDLAVNSVITEDHSSGFCFTQANVVGS
jgi:hypothetical protein